MRSEDQVYGEYCLEGDEEKKEVLLRDLTALLSKHAYAVVWIILQESRPDIVNEALEAILRQLPKFKGRSKFSTWTEAIIRNICRRKLRYHIKHKNDLAIEDVDPSLSPESQIHTRLDISRIRGNLSEEERILFDSQLEGASYKEIQQRLKLDSENAARLRWHRLKTKLARELRSA
jgi:RNA polymerase sigma factor (sigma-70 family)